MTEEQKEKFEEMKEQYKRGYIDGLVAYAHWKNGTQLVGTMGITLDQAIKEIKETWNYLEPLSIE